MRNYKQPRLESRAITLESKGVLSGDWWWPVLLNHPSAGSTKNKGLGAGGWGLGAGGWGLGAGVGGWGLGACVPQDMNIRTGHHSEARPPGGWGWGLAAGGWGVWLGTGLGGGGWGLGAGGLGAGGAVG